MTLNCDKHEFKSVVKVEAEQFEDETIKERTDQISNCFVYVVDALKPVVEMHPLDAETIARWTKVSTKINRVMKSKGNENQKNKSKISSDRFSCDLCPKWYPVKCYLKQHMRRHQLELRYFCDLCPKKCFIKSRLERHVVAHHRKFYCDVCGLHFKNPIRLASHFKQHEELVPCPFCDVKVKAKSLQSHKYYHIHKKDVKRKVCPVCGFMAIPAFLKAHIRTHESFRCRKCRAEFKSLPKLRTHLATVHYDGKGWDCFCGNVYKSKTALKMHQNHLHFSPKHLCEICGQEFSNYAKRTAHWNATHLETHGTYGQWNLQNGSNVTKVLNNGGPYICDICGDVFQKRRRIYIHLKYIHGSEQTFSCDLCPKTYGVKVSIYTHMKQMHLRKLFECKLCSKKFYTKTALRVHSEMHNDKVECQICHKPIANIKKHMKEIHGRKVACTICGNMMLKRYLKQHHRNCHEKEPKMFKCEECDKAFPTKRELLVHKKKIHGFKLLWCHCGFSTDIKERFQIHQQGHKGDSPKYPCPACGLKYKRLNNVRSHWMKVHFKTLGFRTFSRSLEVAS